MVAGELVNEVEIPSTSTANADLAGVNLGVPAPYHVAYRAIIAKARNPGALAATIHAMHAERGPGRPPYSWETIGEALRDLEANGEHFTARGLEVYCRNVAGRGGQSGNGRYDAPAQRQAAKATAIREGVARVLGPGGTPHG